jgi:hypothetical protein
VEVVEVGTEASGALARDEAIVDVVEVGTEIPCVVLWCCPEAWPLCGATLSKVSAPLGPLHECATSPRLMNVAARMATART